MIREIREPQCGAEGIALTFAAKRGILRGMLGRAANRRTLAEHYDMLRNHESYLAWPWLVLAETGSALR